VHFVRLFDICKEPIDDTISQHRYAFFGDRKVPVKFVEKLSLLFAMIPGR
jgi:hypothetical protein